MIHIKDLTNVQILGVYIATGELIIALDKIQNYQHFFSKCVGKVSGCLYHRKKYKIASSAFHYYYKYPNLDEIHRCE